MKIFDIYDIGNVKLEDPGLKRYINLDPKLILKTHGRNRRKFEKGKVNIIERFIGILGVPGHRGKKQKVITSWVSGKYSKNVKILLSALKIIEKQTKENPVQILVKAIENSAPRDGITVIEYGGARYPQAVDVSPLRRLNLAIRHIIHGAYDKAFNKKADISEGIAKEILLAYENSNESYAIKKRNESEKQADAAR